MWLPRLLPVLAGCWTSWAACAVNGEQNNIVNGIEFSKTCAEGQTLDNSAEPRTEESPFVAVTLRACAPPERSYARALQLYNVTMYRSLTIDRALKEITAAHLSGLNITLLILMNLRIAPNAFDAFGRGTDLLRLLLKSVTPVYVERLPASLRYLHLINTELEHPINITHVQLQRFANLTELIIENDEVNITVQATAPLQTMSLNAPFVHVNPVLPDTLENLTVMGWAEAKPKPWQSCKKLKMLNVIGGTITTLPSEWLASCDSLAQLTLKNCGLVSLPQELLYRASSLLDIDLSENELVKLPRNWFVFANKIRKVDLSYNKLRNEVFDGLSAVKSVQELTLAHNEALGDACLSSDQLHQSSTSKLSNLIELRKLDLSYTGATVICRDYRQEMRHLRELYLRYNNITTLTFTNTDSSTEMKVYLEGNNVTRLVYDWDEYRAVTKSCHSGSDDASRAEFLLTSALSCDCDMVAAALALRECPGHRRVAPLRCASGRALVAALDELVCALPARECGAPAPCSCARRPRAPAGAELLRVTCAALPPPRALAQALRTHNATQLILTNTSIAALTRSDLPTNLLDLDLRDNMMTRLEPSIVESLPADGRLWLSGNPLSCDCDDADAVAALIARRESVQDFDKLRCPDGGLLRVPECSESLGTLTAALAPPLALAGLLLGCLARRKVRVRLKIVLRGLGWLPPGTETNDDERPYDVFISFSHFDSAVVGELLRRLEGGARPYRVCVHYRDWAPGGWIPAQIAASVRRSRRTLAVVSEHFLGSAWARAEFREAHAAALRDPEPRLVVVLLDEPARLPLDDELRRYLAANTYVRWGDPWFWHKLRAALPPPRGRTLPPAPHCTTNSTGLTDSADATVSDSVTVGAEQQPLMLQLPSPPTSTLAQEYAKP